MTCQHSKKPKVAKNRRFRVRERSRRLQTNGSRSTLSPYSFKSWVLQNSRCGRCGVWCVCVYCVCGVSVVVCVCCVFSIYITHKKRFCHTGTCHIKKPKVLRNRIFEFVIEAEGFLSDHFGHSQLNFWGGLVLTEPRLIS